MRRRDAAWLLLECAGALVVVAQVRHVLRFSPMPRRRCNICTVGTTVLTQFTLMPEASLGKPLFTNESSIVLTKLTGQII